MVVVDVVVDVVLVVVVIVVFVVVVVCVVVEVVVVVLVAVVVVELLEFRVEVVEVVVWVVVIVAHVSDTGTCWSFVALFRTPWSSSISVMFSITNRYCEGTKQWKSSNLDMLELDTQSPRVQ